MRSIQFPQLARRTLSEQVAEIIRAKISRGELAPGTPLREAELAEQFSVGRAAIREACRQLIGEGLLVYHHRRGPVVWQPTPRELVELYSLRAAMEGMCVRLALENGRRRNLVDALAPIVDEMVEAEKANDFPRVDHLDARFHEAVVTVAEHARLRRVWESAHPVVWTAGIPALRGVIREQVLANKHRRLLSLLETASPQEAQEAMIIHIREGEHDAVARISMDGAAEVPSAESDDDRQRGE